MKLSHSSVTKFQSCPQEWKFHYRDRLRPKLINSSLLFGTAVDRAIQTLLNKEGDPFVAFDEEWSLQTVNGVLVDLAHSTIIVYSNSDFDKDLLTNQDKMELRTVLEQLGFTPDELFITALVDMKKEQGFENLTENQKLALNFGNWLVCRRRGHLMIEAFQQKVMPKIRRVLAVQKEITLDNGAGDIITGFADMVCEMEGYGNVVLDLKTAANPYDESSVLTSPQLTLYVSALGEEFATRLAGYIVLVKRVNKNKVKTCTKCGKISESNRVKTCAETIEGSRCGGEFTETLSPELFEPQVIVDEIPEQTENIVIENFDYINSAIKKEEFHRNFQSCVKPWGKCAYYDLCYKNRTEALIQLEEKKES